MEDVLGRKLIILGLGYSVSDEEFLEFFSAFAGLESAVVVKDGLTGTSRGFGFVTFSTPAAAQALLTEHQLRGPLTLRGRPIDPKLALPKGSVSPAMKQGSMGMAGGHAGSTRLFVGRIPPTVSQEEFKQYFEQFGEIADCFMPLNFGTRQPRGIGFITFASPQSMAAVMQQAHELGGRTLAVESAAPKAEEYGGYSQGFQAGPPQYSQRGGYPARFPMGQYGRPPMGQYGGWPSGPRAPAPMYGYPGQAAGGYGYGGPGPMARIQQRPAYHPYGR